MPRNESELILFSIGTGDKMEPYQISNIEEPTTVILLSVTTVFTLVAILLYGLILRYVLKQKPPRRPVDQMLLIDQAVKMTSYTISAGVYLPMLWTNRSMLDLFGQAGCWMTHVALPIFMWQEIIGTLGIACFRYLFMARPDLLQRHGIERTKRFIWAMETLIVMTPLLATFLAPVFNFKTGSHARCHGTPTELSLLITEITLGNSDSQLWKMFGRSFLPLGMMLIIFELVLDVKLYHLFRKQTNKMKTSLTKTLANKRYKKNVINLKGQLIGFILKFMAIILIIAFYFLNDQYFGLKQYWFMCIWMISVAFSNISTILASPDLRREYLGDDDIIWPRFLM